MSLSLGFFLFFFKPARSSRCANELHTFPTEKTSWYGGISNLISLSLDLLHVFVSLSKKKETKKERINTLLLVRNLNRCQRYHDVVSMVDNRDVECTYTPGCNNNTSGSSPQLRLSYLSYPFLSLVLTHMRRSLSYIRLIYELLYIHIYIYI